jgi:hypothetical protein
MMHIPATGSFSVGLLVLSSSTSPRFVMRSTRLPFAFPNGMGANTNVMFFVVQIFLRFMRAKFRLL